MKTRKILAAGIAALALSSCSTITHTSQTAAVDTQIYNLTVADMKVAAKKDSVTVDWKWNPLSTVSLKAQKESATHSLLSKSEADVLVEPEYIVKRRGIFRGGSVTVTGYPATYSNFRAMSKDDAEKIATVNGDASTVMVNPVISTTAGKVAKKRKPVVMTPRRKNIRTQHRFVNLLGGIAIDADDNVEAGYQFGAMYGSYGSGWGWYGKLALSSTTCTDWENNYEESRKWTPAVTVGGIKTISGCFSAFAGIGVGGYFVNDHGYDDEGEYYDKDCTKFSIPVDLGFMLRIKSVNVMIGATYATPLGGIGSGNVNPFAGVGFSF